MGLVLDLVMLAGDAVIAGILYRLLWMNDRQIDSIQKAPTVTINDTLMRDVLTHDNHELPYVCVEGSVRATKETLKSEFTDHILGVVKTNKMYELKSTRTRGFWHDSKDVIRDTVAIVPFFLSDGDKPSDAPATRIHVSDPLLAGYLVDNLRETHNSFLPNASSGMSRGIDRIFGDVTKGYDERETMLPIGSTLLGIGKLVAENGELFLRRPDINVPYILTLLTRGNVTKCMERTSTVYRVLLATCAAIGAGFAYVALKHAYHKYTAYRQTRAAVEFYKRMRAGDGGESDADVENMCVICLTNTRQVVLLDCGHICLCVECADNLPEPATCPICRARITRTLPVYLP